MITIKSGCRKTLACAIDDVEALAYDGLDYALLTHPYRGILRLDQELCIMDRYPSTQQYHCLCFAAKDCCYYACSQNHPNNLFCLDLNFKIIKKSPIHCHYNECPCSISAHPTYPLLFLLYENEIVIWDLSCNRCVRTICIPQDRCVISIIALHDGYCLSYHKDDREYIEVYSENCDESMLYAIPSYFDLLTMVIMETYASHYEINLLLYACTNDTIISHMLYISILTDEETSQPCPIPQPIAISCEESKNEVIHSIALEEAGIAHILNAEGEKIQKAVASDISIEELLMVNASVQKTIMQITQLEGQLYLKLENLHCICAEENQS